MHGQMLTWHLNRDKKLAFWKLKQSDLLLLSGVTQHVHVTCLDLETVFLLLMLAMLHFPVSQHTYQRI